MVRLQGEGGPIRFPSPWSRTTRPSAIRTRRAPRAWPPARTPQSRARLARATGPCHTAARRSRWRVGFQGHHAPSGEEAQTSRPPLAAKSARDAPIHVVAGYSGRAALITICYLLSCLLTFFIAFLFSSQHMSDQLRIAQINNPQFCCASLLRQL